MPEKLGNGGHSLEDYDPKTGKYVADGEPNKYHDNPKESYGYHAGDLGKAESFFSQSGNRGTGHFGTGTYFVSNPNVFDEGYKERPIHKINFNNYNLYKPSNNDFGYQLHDTLKLLNEDFGFYHKYLNVKDDVDFLGGIKHDGKYIDVDFVYGNNNAEKIVDAYNNLVNKEIIDGEPIYYQPEPKTDVDDDDWLGWFLSNENEDSIEDKAFMAYENFYKEMISGWNAPIDRIENMKNITNKLNNVLEGNHTEEEINDALENTLNAYNEYNSLGGWYSEDSKNWDSLSTVFMKNLGYEGVDVRHLGDNGDTSGLDNTKYGSVIYNLKDEDLKQHEKAKENRKKAQELFGLNFN